ncbi:hypothetical protein OG216_26905 [Streptomycetaceae bacterium NBC_01309]
MSSMPPSRSLLAVDVKGASAHEGVSFPHVNHAVHDVVRKAFRKEGISWKKDVLELKDDGDGLIAVLPDEYVARLVDVVRELHDELRAARRAFQGPPLDLRVAVHHGPVELHRPGRAAFVELARMLDSEGLRGVLAGTRAHLAVMVSDHVYRAAVLNGYTRTVEAADFHRLDIEEKGMKLATWVHTPTNDMSPAPDNPLPVFGRSETPLPRGVHGDCDPGPATRRGPSAAARRDLDGQVGGGRSSSAASRQVRAYKGAWRFVGQSARRRSVGRGGQEPAATRRCERERPAEGGRVLERSESCAGGDSPESPEITQSLS